PTCRDPPASSSRPSCAASSNPPSPPSPPSDVPMSRLAPLLAAASLLSGAAPAPAQEPVYQDRWFYASHNLQGEKNADELVKLTERAGKAGYNGVVLADYKLNILDRVPKHYFANLEKVKKSARANGIEIIPAVFPIGYSSGILAHDPNLAEGMPV